MRPDPDPATVPMLADIFRQPQLLSALIDRREEAAAFARQWLHPDGGSFHAFGSGDGWFAARAALSGQTVGGKAARASASLDFLLNVAPGLTSRDRVLGITMSGAVDRSLQSAQAALAAGPVAALLTNTTGGRVGALGLPRFELGIAEIGAFLCGTSSYTASVLALAMLTDTSPLPRAVEGALADLPAFLQAVNVQAAELAARDGAQLPGIRILGVGQSVATADYGAAKMVEVTTVPAWSDDIEEFAHRQYWAMARREIVVLLPADAASAPFASAAAEALGRLGVATVSIEAPETPVPDARHRFRCPASSAALPVVQAIVLQLLSYHLGHANGTDPDRRPHLKDDVEKFTVSRLLTRRSLVGSGM